MDGVGLVLPLPQRRTSGAFSMAVAQVEQEKRKSLKHSKADSLPKVSTVYTPRGQARKKSLTPRSQIFNNSDLLAPEPLAPRNRDITPKRGVNSRMALPGREVKLESITTHHYRNIYRKSILSIAFSEQPITEFQRKISLKRQGISMIEEIFDLRNIVNYSELKFLSCVNPNPKKAESETMPAIMSSELQDILVLSDIEVTIRLIATLGQSLISKKLSSKPEETWTKNGRRELNRTVPGVDPILLDIDAKAYKNLEEQLEQGHQEQTFGWDGTEMGIQDVIGEMVDGEKDNYYDDEENCLDEENADSMMVRGEVIGREGSSNPIESLFVFGDLGLNCLTHEFLGNLGVN